MASAGELTPSARRSPALSIAVRAVQVAVSVAPIALLIVVFFIIPMFFLFRMSFLENRNDVIGLSLFSGYNFENYYELIRKPLFYEMLYNSFVTSILTALASVVIGYCVAWYIIHTSGWERTLIAAICLLPIFVNLVVATFGWSILLSPFGVLQKTLVALGFINDRRLTISQTVWGLIIVKTYQCLPFAILILASSIQSIRADKINAAKLLGASGFRIVRTVLLPLTMPGIFATFILVFSLSVSSYLVPVMIGGGRVPVLAMYIYTVTIETHDLPMGAAMSMILLGIVLIMTYGLGKLATRASRRGKWAMV